MIRLSSLIDILVDIRDCMHPDERDTAMVLVGLSSRNAHVVSSDDADVTVWRSKESNTIEISSDISEDAHLFISFDKDEEDVSA